jgi:hypothetical protein
MELHDSLIWSAGNDSTRIATDIRHRADDGAAHPQPR